MDSQHRHELKENDLFEFMLNARQWWSKYGHLVLIVLVVVIGFFTIRRVIGVTSQTRHEAAWSELASTTSPEVFRTVAETSRDPAVKALALLRGADLMVQQTAHPPLPDVMDPNAPAPEPVTPEQRERLLQDAALMYQQVIDLPQAHPAVKLNAQLGLATVAEAQGDIEQARTWYTAVEQSAAGISSAIAAQARGRLAVLDRLGRPVVFGDPVDDVHEHLHGHSHHDHEHHHHHEHQSDTPTEVIDPAAGAGIEHAQPQADHSHDHGDDHNHDHSHHPQPQPVDNDAAELPAAPAPVSNGEPEQPQQP